MIDSDRGLCAEFQSVTLRAKKFLPSHAWDSKVPFHGFEGHWYLDRRTKHQFGIVRGCMQMRSRIVQEEVTEGDLWSRSRVVLVGVCSCILHQSSTTASPSNRTEVPFTHPQRPSLDEPRHLPLQERSWIDHWLEDLRVRLTWFGTKTTQNLQVSPGIYASV